MCRAGGWGGVREGGDANVGMSLIANGCQQIRRSTREKVGATDMLSF